MEEQRDKIQKFIHRRARTKAEAKEIVGLLSWLLEETRSDAYCEGHHEGWIARSDDYCA